MIITYNKRVINGTVAQLFLVTTHHNAVKYEWYKATRPYYGEGVKKEEMVEITLDEFRELANEHNSLTADFISPASSHNS